MESPKMEIFSYTLCRRLDRKNYAALFDFAAAKGAYALLVIREGEELSSYGKNLIEKLAPFLISQDLVSEWPGTLLFDHKALSLKYEITCACAEILKAASPGLYHWLAPRLPEDLCFLRQDGSPWFVSIAHEKDSYFSLDTREYDLLLKSLPGFGQLLSRDD